MISNRSASISFIRVTFFYSFFGFFTLNLIANHGLANGIHLALLGWSFYVMCLPFLGGGALFYPLATVIGSLPDYIWESAAWGAAIALHIFTYLWNKSVYGLTTLSHFLQWSIEHPFPYWIIFILNLLPLIALIMYRTDCWPYRRIWYYQLRLILSIFALGFLCYIAMYDMIILSNIHA